MFPANVRIFSDINMQGEDWFNEKIMHFYLVAVRFLARMR